MDMLQNKFHYYNIRVDRELSKYPQIINLERQTGIPKTYLAASVVGIVFVLIFFNVWGSLFSNIIGWLYPAYASFKAIESAKKTDDTQWLTYWLSLPPFNGAKIVYARGIRPFLLEYQDAVDENLDKWKRKVDPYVEEAFESSSNFDRDY
nr:10460_t:CDS:2 [Entrophospora candida]